LNFSKPALFDQYIWIDNERDSPIAQYRCPGYGEHLDHLVAERFQHNFLLTNEFVDQ
jgi:hypothetical protein